MLSITDVISCAHLLVGSISLTLQTVGSRWTDHVRTKPRGRLLHLDIQWYLG